MEDRSPTGEPPDSAGLAAFPAGLDGALPAEESPAILVRDLRKVYGAKAAVDGLDLSIPRGCFFGFLGPNGAGKTTTIRMLMGLAPPSSGTIELLGLPMPEKAVEIKRRIGLVPDESLLFDHLTGGRIRRAYSGRMLNPAWLGLDAAALARLVVGDLGLPA